MLGKRAREVRESILHTLPDCRPLGGRRIHGTPCQDTQQLPSQLCLPIRLEIAARQLFSTVTFREVEQLSFGQAGYETNVHGFLGSTPRSRDQQQDQNQAKAGPQTLGLGRR